MPIHAGDPAPIGRAGDELGGPLLPEGGAVTGVEADPLPAGQDV
ncbi:MAG: hypothetical protein RQM90_13425 [Methanoculleus sp.]